MKQKKKQLKYILRPFREMWFAQVSLLDVTELSPHRNSIKRLYKALDDGNLFFAMGHFRKNSSYTAYYKGLTLETSAYKPFTLANLRYQLSY